MIRIAFSMLLLSSLAACGGEAESREVQDNEAVPQPTQGQGQPQSAAPDQPVRAIPAGTILTFEVREEISTSSHEAGDSFSLVLVDAVSGPGGALVAAGSPARGVVTDAHSSTGSDDVSLLGVNITSLQAGGVQKAVEGVVQSAVLEGDTQESGKRTAATIGIGAAAGALVGQILGGSAKSTVIGAVAGTAVGVGVALTKRGGDATLPRGSRIVFQLDRDLVF
ncbi:MAG: hypothetical protein RQ745_10605 [Longimicrobiales bacterium]|nr:hypothetical protein [Longimicrobiales bacterium]